MMDLFKRYQNAVGNLPSQIKEAEANIETIIRTDLWVKNGSLSRSQAFNQTKIYAYATVNSTGMVYTEDTEEDPISVFSRAANNSLLLSSPKRILRDETHSLSTEEGKTATVDEMESLGCLIESHLRFFEVVELRVSTAFRRLQTVNSLGLDSQTTSSWVEVEMEIRSTEDSRISGLAFSSAMTIDGLDAKIIAEKAMENAKENVIPSLSQVSLKSGKFNAVLSSQVMRNIFMTAWLEFSSRQMEKKGSLFKDVPSTQVGASCINISNVPSHPLIGQTWRADSAGQEVIAQTIVKNGLLNQSLKTLGRVAQMTGNIPIELTTVPSLFFIESGSQTEEALIEKMGNGLLITYSLDLFHSVNIASGDFSIPCGGFWISEGKKFGSVSQLTMVGNIGSLLQSIDSVANNLGFDYFYFRTYCVGSPSVLANCLSFSC